MPELLAISPGSEPQRRAMMFPLQGKSTTDLPFFKQDLASFLLIRGPHAFFGHAWKGCSLQYAFPSQLNLDYGEPTDTLCTETGTNSGIFTRTWSKATVQMDCNTYTADITMTTDFAVDAQTYRAGTSAFPG